MPCRNYGRFLPQALDSLLEQLHENWEVIVVDEASQDDTRAIVNGYRTRMGERLRYIRNDAPVGLQKVSNTVLGLANGKYLMRLDADDWLDESALLLLVAKLESDPKLGLAYGNFYYVNEEGKYIGTERRRKFGVEDMSGHMPPHGACTMVSTRALKAAGGYTGTVNAQDGWDLWFRLKNRVGVAHLDAPIFYYRQHGRSLSRDVGRLLEARAGIISKARERLQGDYLPTCLAVLPVRENYPDWQGVPYETIHGQSLIERALTSAFRAVGVSDVAISTDSEGVLNYVDSIKDKVRANPIPILRPHGASSHFNPRDILLQAAEGYRLKYNTFPDIVLFLNIHAHARTAEHISSAINTIILTNADSVVSVTQEREPMFAHGTDGLELLNPGRFDGLEYEKENLYRFNGLVIGTWFDNLRAGSLFGKSIAHIEMDRNETFQVRSKNDVAALLKTRTD